MVSGSKLICYFIVKSLRKQLKVGGWVAPDELCYIGKQDLLVTHGNRALCHITAMKRKPSLQPRVLRNKRCGGKHTKELVRKQE